MLKILALVSCIAMSQLCYAEIKVYESTDNTGINKKEQIDVIEKYLSTLGSQLQKMEEKLDANTTKLKALETTISSLKENDIKKIQDQLADKKEASKASLSKEESKEAKDELEKLKADILAIKNNDVEPIRQDVNALRFSVKNIETILKIPGK